MNIFNLFRRRAKQDVFTPLAQAIRAADIVRPEFIAGEAPPKTYAEVMDLHRRLGQLFQEQAHWHSPEVCDTYGYCARDLAQAVKNLQQRNEISQVAAKKINQNLLRWSPYLSARDERVVKAIIVPNRKPWFLHWRPAFLIH